MSEMNGLVHKINVLRRNCTDAVRVLARLRRN